MTDNIVEPQVSAPAVSTDSAPIATPAIDTPIAAPIESTPELISSPAEPAVTETPASEIPVSDNADADNILGGTDAPKEGAPKEGEAKLDGDKPIDAPAETPIEVALPVYEDFKLPENYNVDKESIGEFTKLLGELEVASGKLDHKGYQEAGQKLIDLGTKNVQASIERLNEYYSQFHENQKKEWFESFKKDPEMGGERLQETVGVLRNAVEQYGGTPEQISEFRQIMKDTGVGNHPSVTRLLFNMQQKINKYETESDNGNGGSNRIVPGAKPAPSKVKNYQQFYGGGN